MSREGQLIAQRFSLQRLAGRGGMGEVYRAVDTTTGQPVALKLLRDDAGSETQRFMREARVLSQLHHPAIVRHFAHGVTDTQELYLAMQWLEGEDLASRLGRGPLSADDAVAVAARTCDALEAAHQAGVIHRDLKPHNLFLVDGDLRQVTLLDFGIARVALTQAKTRTGAMLGTPAYMSPEQARGDRALDERCDIWALGAVLFECLTGQLPFTGEHVMAVLGKVLFENAPLLRDVCPQTPAGLCELVQRMLSRRPEERPRSAAEVREGLSSLAPAPLLLHASPSARLTGGEQRRLFVVLASQVSRVPAALDATASPGLSSTDAPQASHALSAARLSALATEHQAQVEALFDGSVVAAVRATGSAGDAAARAARCALALKHDLPHAHVALATGRGVVNERVPVGDVIDSAAGLLTANGSDALVPIDEGTAALLEGRFDFERRETGVWLKGEAHTPETVRTLMGQPSPFIGRDREVGILNGVLAEAINEPAARAVVVTAPPGTGKSRLRYEFLKQVTKEHRARVWLARGDPSNAGSPFGLMAQLLRAALGVRADDPLPQRRARLRDRVALQVPPAQAPLVAAFLGELCNTPFDGSVELNAARADPALMADQTRRALEVWLGAECREQPVLLVLEDLHWGDGSTVSHLGHALNTLKDSPLMVLAMARPEVSQVFPSLWAGLGLLEVNLGELSRKASERLARHVLKDKVDAATIERLATLAQGNAFYLEELIRAVAEGRGAVLPDSVLAMAQSRFETLEDEARALLRAASVFGERFWAEPVAALAFGQDTATAERWLTELTARELMEARVPSRFGGQREFTFRHALLREAAYQALTEEDRRAAHRSAAQFLTQAGETDAMALAGHHFIAQQLPLAAQEFHRAATHALEGGDFASVGQRVQLALKCGVDDTQREALELLEVEALRWGSDQVAFLERGAALLARVKQGSGPWMGLVADLAVMSWRLVGYRPDDLLARADELLHLDVEENLQAQFVRASSRVATQACIALKHREIAPLIERIEQVAAAVAPRDTALQAWVEQLRGFHAAGRGALGTGRAHLLKSAQLFESIGDLRNGLAERVDCLFTLLEGGRLAELVDEATEVVERCRAMGLTRLVAIARILGLFAEAQLGRAREVLVAMRQTAAELQPRHSHFAIGAIMLAETELDVGEADAALATIARCSLTGSTLYWVQPAGTWMRAMRALGRDAEVLAALPAEGRQLAVLSDVAGGSVRLRLRRAQVMERAGRLPEAKRAARELRDHLLDRAAQLGEPQREAQFLAGLKERVDVMDLDRRLNT